MIGSLRGRLLELFGDGEVLIEVGGVGYRVIVTPTTAVRLGDVGGDVFVHVHHHIREADQTLYGFLERDERTCFEALLSAHGVGPSLALAVLGVHGPVELARLLADDDVAALCLVPGVGKKTATRLLVELKNSLDLPIDGVPVNGDGPAAERVVVRDERDAVAMFDDRVPRALQLERRAVGEALALSRDF